MINRTWNIGEIPPFAFCEPVTAPPLGKWCIRPITPDGLKLGGGVDTPSLCGRVKPFGLAVSGQGSLGGWDLNVRMTEPQLAGRFVCQKCLAEYRKLVAKP